MIRTVLATLAAVLALAAPAAASGFQPGSSGLGDPFFPLAGNGGYDVKHYSLDLDYVRATNQLDGKATILAQAKQNLSRFNLDLRGYDISDLEVNGRDARFDARRAGADHHPAPRSDPRAPVPRAGRVLRPARAGRRPRRVARGLGPDRRRRVRRQRAAGLARAGTRRTTTRRTRRRSTSRSPCPEGITAIANGRLLSKRTRGGKTTWHWLEDSPMAPYLATATNGVFELRTSKAGRLPLYQAVDPKVANPALAFERLSAEAEVIAFFSDLYGKYPFSSGGGVVDNGGVGYALESQTKSMYDVQGNPNGAPGASTVVHEISHQWFGNAVTNAVWPDIWLNEGFARFSEWIYTERHGGITAQQSFLNAYNSRPATSSFWRTPPAVIPGPEVMFSSPPYDRGGMTLQALRVKIGDNAFFGLLRSWYSRNKYGNVTTADFIAAAERASGAQLDAFFDVWLFQPVKPLSW